MTFHPRLVAYLAFLVLPLLFVGFCDIFHEDISPIFTHSIVSILFILGLVSKLIVWSQRRHYHFVDQQVVAQNNAGVEQLLMRHYHKIGVLIFGIASLWFAAIVSLNYFYCFEYFQHYNVSINTTCNDCEELWLGLNSPVTQSPFHF